MKTVDKKDEQDEGQKMFHSIVICPSYVFYSQGSDLSQLCLLQWLCNERLQWLCNERETYDCKEMMCMLALYVFEVHTCI